MKKLLFSLSLIGMISLSSCGGGAEAAGRGNRRRARGQRGGRDHPGLSRDHLRRARQRVRGEGHQGSAGRRRLDDDEESGDGDDGRSR